MTDSALLNAVIILQIIGTVFASGTEPRWIIKKDEFSKPLVCVGLTGAKLNLLNCVTSDPIKEGPSAGLFKNGVLYDKALPDGQAVLKFTIIEGSAIDIGITDKSKFNKNALGLLYEGRGRLSDGQNGIIYSSVKNGSWVRRGIMVDEYGPELKTGDVIIMTSIVSKNLVQLYFSVNDVPLGEAFRVPRNSLEDKLFPVVKVPVNSDSNIYLEYETDMLPALTRAPQKHLEPLDGRWTYLSGSIKNPSNRNIVLKFAKQDNVDDILQASVDIINTLNFQLKRIDKDGKRWMSSNGATSLVGGSPEDMQLEQAFSGFFWGKELSFVEEGEDILISKNSNGDELKWKRLYIIPQVITFDPFQE